MNAKINTARIAPTDVDQILALIGQEGVRGHATAEERIQNIKDFVRRIQIARNEAPEEQADENQ